MKQIKPLTQREKPTRRDFNDLEGETFGRLSVISYAGGRKKQSGQVVHYWNCKCVCDSECIVGHDNLRNKRTESCGCYKIDKATKHGASRGNSGGKPSSEYRKWMAMKNYCLYPEDKNYKHYGGIGISICDRWLYSFENFLSDVGPRPDGCRLGRIDKSGNYEPGNCKWMTLRETLGESMKANLARGRRSRRMPAKEEAA